VENFWTEHTYLLYGLLIGAFGYIIWTLKAGFRAFALAIKEIRERQTTLREATLPNEYVRIQACDKHIQEVKEQYNKDMKDVKDLLGKIFDKLDLKLDRDGHWDGRDRRER
jgi:rRNA maturation endonuclease Nob1